MFDRHSFAHAPICVNGRMFTPGEQVLYATDAYNGTPIWTADVPELAPRVNIARDSGYVAANEKYVFVGAADRCLCLKADTGKRLPPYLLPPMAAQIRPPIVLADFEANDYGDWKVEGDAFGSGPLAVESPAPGSKGKRLVSTYLKADTAPQGKLTSPVFKIERPYIGFLIGGGRHEHKTCVNLVVDGKVARTATAGINSKRLYPHAWDVANLLGRQARVEIVDGESGDWGYVNVDQIELRDQPYEYEWGYLAIQDGLLFGTGVRAGNFYRRGRGPNYKWEKEKVTGDFLFAVDQEDRELRWKHDGVVVGSSITIGGGRVYFVEHRDPRILKSARRRLGHYRNMALVALDMCTGKRLWEVTSLSSEKSSPELFLQYKDEVLVLVRTTDAYDIQAYNAAGGQVLWKQRHQPTHWDHGAFRRKTIIVGNDVYQEPIAYDLKTGQQKWQGLRRSKCAPLAASAHYLVGRNWNHSIIDIRALQQAGDASPSEALTSVTRPGCWISVIAAGGLILAPEAASGCQCDFPIRTSMAFTSAPDEPKAKAKRPE